MRPGTTALPLFTAPCSAIGWVGALTESGYPPAGVPTTGCINDSTAIPMCQ
jgi:hypothetical protein